MSEAYTGEIRMFAGNFAPRDWAFCNGQQMSISQNEALFSLLGGTFGTDGQTVFNLPHLQGRLPVGQGAGPGLTPRLIGQVGGSETVTLTTPQMPAHNHAFNASTAAASTNQPESALVANTVVGDVTNFAYNATVTTPATLNAQSVSASGGGQPHDNVMPFLCINFIICLTGLYPSRN